MTSHTSKGVYYMRLVDPAWLACSADQDSKKKVVLVILSEYCPKSFLLRLSMSQLEFKNIYIQSARNFQKFSYPR